MDVKLSMFSEIQSSSEKRKSAGRLFAWFIAIPILILFSCYQIYHCFRYGSIMVPLRHYARGYVHYAGHEFAFVFAVMDYAFLVLFFVLGLGVRWLPVRVIFTRRDKAFVKNAVVGELTRSRISFEDQRVIEPFDRR